MVMKEYSQFDIQKVRHQGTKYLLHLIIFGSNSCLCIYVNAVSYTDNTHTNTLSKSLILNNKLAHSSVTIILRFRLSVVVNTLSAQAIWHQRNVSFLSINKVPSGGWKAMNPDNNRFLQMLVVWTVETHESTSSWVTL